MKITHKYDDIIHLPHHVSPKRSRMTNYDRAAQFSPFAALTGYDGVIQETSRLTDTRIELDEGGKALLDEKLQLIREHIAHQPRVTLTCFRPDERKCGGAYVHVTGHVKKLDEYRNAVIFSEGNVIPIGQVYGIECDL